MVVSVAAASVRVAANVAVAFGIEAADKCATDIAATCGSDKRCILSLEENCKGKRASAAVAPCKADSLLSPSKGSKEARYEAMAKLAGNKTSCNGAGFSCA